MSIHQAHTTPREEQANIHDRLYNNQIVIMHAILNRTLQQLNPIKINNRNRIFNRRAKLGYLTCQVASLSILICATIEVEFTVFTKLLDCFVMGGVRLNIIVFVKSAVTVVVVFS